MKARLAGLVAALALLVGVGAAPANAAPAVPTSTTAVVVVPTYSFCQVVGWWHSCRTKPQTGKCFFWYCW